MNILVVSSTPWNGKNSFGNSFSNIFNGIDNIRFANVCCKPGNIENHFDMIGFQITESMLINNLRHRSHPSGKVVHNCKTDGIQRSRLEEQTFNKARLLRWQVFFWGRDLIWKAGRWKSTELKKFIDDFQPDLIFQPVYYSSYLNDIAQFVKKYTNVPMVGYISDDNYTLRQFHLSPLYWIDRLWKRTKVKRTIDMCEILYVISDIQKQEYEKIFRPECKILTKCADFENSIPVWPKSQKPVVLLYAGGISAGRFESLKLLANAVEKLNCEEIISELHIYTSTPLPTKKQLELSKQGCFLHNAVPYEELISLQKKADILVHVEGLSLKERLQVHQSFSTKLVDYFVLGKCIFAIGTEDVASIKHLIDNDAAIVACDKKEVYVKLKSIVEEPELIIHYGEKAYKCGKKHHGKDRMQSMLKEDLVRVAKL